jgi:protein-S-isoprenylcysteine O-methyltransferase Ste14
MVSRKNMGVGPLFMLGTTGFFLLGVYVRWNLFPLGGGLYGLVWPFWFSGMLFFGLGVHLWSGAMFHVWDAIQKMELSRKGPYRIVRHPMYAGTLFMMSGAGLIWMGIIAILPATAAYLLLKRLIEIEEKELMDRYGETYENYRKQVPPIFPGMPKDLHNKKDETEE